MKPHFYFPLFRLSWVVLALLLLVVAPLAARPNISTPTLASVLNPDGTLRPGISGSFDASRFTLCTASDGRPIFRPTGAGDERWQNMFGLSNGADDRVLAIAQFGTTVYFGGKFRVVGGIVANHVAKWNGTAWSSLGTGTANGTDFNVNALAVASNGDLYAGGEFSTAGGVASHGIAHWNGTSWSALGNGMFLSTTTVKALATGPNGMLYVGGHINSGGDITAKWDGTNWTNMGSMGNSINQRPYDEVTAIAVAGNGDVYVAGTFSGSGTVTKWNGTALRPLGAGLPLSFVNSLAVTTNGDMYAGGNARNGSGISCVAKWNGTVWSSVGSGLFDNTGSGNVIALVVGNNGNVYAGGNFTNTGTGTVNCVAQWDGTTWNALGAGMGYSGASGNSVYALAVTNTGDVYAGGTFGQAGTVGASNVAHWNRATWNVLGTGNGAGLNGRLLALAVAPNGNVYVGGSFFNNAGGVPVSNVACWNGTTWNDLGGGVTGFVKSLAVAANGNLYVGGLLPKAGTVAVNNVARWNGTTWNAMGPGLTGNVNALVVASNGDVYAGGDFVDAGTLTVNRVGRWDGTSWHALGTGLNADVSSLALASNGDLYVGQYTNVARWNGTGWSTLGNGPSGPVYALSLSSTGDVYAGGEFYQGGQESAVAHWNGTTWSMLGSLIGRSFGVAVAANGDVYAGGNFLYSPNGRISPNGIYRWNGVAWSTPGTGLNDDVIALRIGPNSKVYAAGVFSAVGDSSKVTSRLGVYDPLAPLATTIPTLLSSCYLYPNPARAVVTLYLVPGTIKKPLVLLDALGRTVRQFPAPTKSETTLDVRGLPAGSYLLRCGTSRIRLVLE